MNALAPYMLAIKLGALAVLLVGAGVLCWRCHRAGVAAGVAQCAVEITTGDRKHSDACTKAADGANAAAVAVAQAAARAQERASQEKITAIEAHYAQELSDAKAESDRVVSDLRAGSLRLREQWRGCEAATGVPAPAARVVGTDAATIDRRESAGRIVRTADDADAQIRALQAVIRADRALIPSSAEPAR